MSTSDNPEPDAVDRSVAAMLEALSEKRRLPIIRRIERLYNESRSAAL